MLVLLPLAWLAVSSFVRRGAVDAVAGGIAAMAESGFMPDKPPTPSSNSSGNTISCSRATPAHVKMTLDSASAAGPSPMQALAFALAGCMAMDVVHVITKGPLRPARAAGGSPGTRAPTIHTASPRSRCTTRSPATCRTKRSSAQSNCRATSTAPSGIRCARTSSFSVTLHGDDGRLTHRRHDGDTPAAWISRLDARPRRARHDRGARHRQLDAPRRPPLLAVHVGDDPRRVRRAAVPLPRRALGGALRRVQSCAERAMPRPQRGR